MRLLSQLTLCLFFLSASNAFAQAPQASGEPVQLQTKMDANLKNILDVVVGAFVNRIPGASKDSKVEMNGDSDLSQGKAKGAFNVVLNSEDGQTTFATNGVVDIGMTRAADGAVAIDVLTNGQVASESLLQSLEMINKSLNASPLISSDMTPLSASQKAATALEKLKQNMMAFIDGASQSGAPAKKTQSFGSAKPRASEASQTGVTLDAEVAAQLRNAVATAFNITAGSGETIFSIDMNVIKSIDSEVVRKNPLISMLTSFASVEMIVGDAETKYTLVSHAEISSQLVTTYDAYLAQEQSKPEGLKNLSELIGKIGIWAVGRCSTEKYQGLCVDKILNGCPKNVKRVQVCVDQMKAVQDGRDTGNVAGNGAAIFGMEAGAYIDDGLDATGQAINDAGTSISNGIGSLWNNLTGNNQTPPESK
jgi:hypothetical protein